MSFMLHLGLFIMVMTSLNFVKVAEAETGICYGRLGDNLPSPSEVVSLCNQHNIRRMRIYDPYPPTLQALGGFDIELMLGLPNSDLQHVAASQDNANAWVQNNVRNYPSVRFRYIAVGNEVSPARPETSQYSQFVLPAMQNIQTAISAAGLANQIKVSTSLDTIVLKNTYPPEDGVFRPDVASYITPIIAFLVDNRSPFLANIYPYFAYIGDKENIPLEFALFTSDARGATYHNLFYAMLDGLYAALEKSGGSSLEVVVSESGWPSAGGDTTTVEYSRTYNTNLVRFAKDGTPKRPRQPIETYIFAMFDENQKGSDNEKHERNFGIFLPSGQPKYAISLN